MEDKFTYRVQPEDEQYAVKDIMRHRFSFSARLRTKIKKEHLLYLNGEPVAGWIKPRAGDFLSVRLPEERSHFEPQDIPIEPVYEDDDLLIVNKQPGVVVHPTQGQPDHTMANGLMKYLADTGQNFKIRFVNRLDRDTSGLLVIAKNSYTQEGLTQQMKRRATRKYYTALLCGLLEKESGTVNLPIGKPDPNRVERGIVSEDSGGFPSVTHYRVLGRHREPLLRMDPLLTVDKGFVEGACAPFSEAEAARFSAQGLLSKAAGYTLAELLLETGRTHQIRVHMGALGHFVLGDTLYGGVLCRRNAAGMYEALTCRQMLHARRLCFTQPVTGRELEVEAPLPADFLACAAELPEAAQILNR